MQKIIPHLWYDKEAKEATELYVSLFENSRILRSTILEGTPSGDAELINFELAGQRFDAISAGPYFPYNPSISLMVSCNTKEEVDAKWAVLSQGGVELMPLDKYPFSDWYAWVQDRYGLTWQLMLAPDYKPGQKIKPCFLFSNEVCGRAEEAVNYYVEVFQESEISMISRYGEGEAPAECAKINFCAFTLEGTEFVAMDNGMGADFTFNEALSLEVVCQNQAEIDYYWEKLSFVPEAEQCGWLKDQFGVSWQIVPAGMEDILFHGTPDEIRRVTEAFLQMKKFDLEALEKARLGE